MATQRRIQSYTKIGARCLGGSVRLSGYVLFARADEVTNEEFWKKEKNIGLIVSCVRNPRDVRYPAATSQIEVIHFDIRSKDKRQQHFDECWPKVEACLLRGEDVLFHCQESYHRAPICWACCYQQIAGVRYKVLHVIIIIFT